MALLGYTPNDAADRIFATWQSSNDQPACPVVIGDSDILLPCIVDRFAASASVLRDPSSADLLQAWCRDTIDLPTVIGGISLYLSHRAGLDAGRLRATLADANEFSVRRLLRDACINGETVTGRLIHALCKAYRNRQKDQATSLLRVISEFLSAHENRDNAVMNTLEALLDFVPSSEHPIALCTFEDLQSAATIQAMVLRVPRIRVVFVFSSTVYTKLLAKTDSFSKATFQQLVLELQPPITESEISTSTADDNEFEHWSECLRNLPVTEGLIRTARDQLQASAKVTDQETADNARSAAESFLFQTIAAHPKIEHEFELNRVMDFRFGSRNAEIDLACTELKIAIEIDGYFHFRDDDSYRRDRRKDVLLQTHGYHVLRFLANDIVPHIDSILQTIMSAISFREHQTNCDRPEIQSRKPK